MAEIKRNLQAEMRSFAAIGRTARVRPILFTAVVGLPLAVFAGTATLVAVQPARFLANYERGLRLASAGDVEHAADYFAAAVSSAPSYVPARFQLARTRIAIGQLDLALDDFSQLARNEGDAHSMAYAGYCFNLKGLPVAAIPWYERATHNGAASAAIYNNLGASYLDARTHVSHAERIRLAELYLLKALQLDSRSITIQLNIVRLAIARSKTDPAYDPFRVWRHAKTMLNDAPNDPFVRFQVSLWYNAVVNRADASTLEKALSKTDVSAEEKAAREEFAEHYRPIHHRTQDAESADTATSPNAAANDLSSLALRYFLEPLLLDGAQP